jgi:DNA-binding beta-propeller fold protein YncE
MRNYLNKNLYVTVLYSLIVFIFMSGTSHAFKVTRLKHLFYLEHGLLQPSDVAVGKDHLIYVMDGVNNRVVVFDQQGNLSFTFGGKGSGNGLFNAPLGITIDSQGNVYVADSGNRRIQIFSSRGQFRSLFAVTSQPGEKPADPVDLALDEGRKRIYVVDNDNHRILVYSLTDYKLLESWSSEGEGMQLLRNPFFIALAKDTSLLVVDVLNTRVQVWTPQGEAVSTIGGYGVDLGQLYRPKGVCVDKDNNIFVSDSYVGAIQTFNRYGYFKTVAGDETGEVMIWKTPVGITIDDRQRFYVVEMIPNRVSVYQILDTIEKEVR